MEHISFYTTIINSSDFQATLAEYREIFLLISLVFLLISIFFIFNQKLFVADAKRRIGDFFADTSLVKPRKFVQMWMAAKSFYKKGDYDKFIVKADELILKILKRFGYLGKDVVDIIEGSNVKDETIPNTMELKRICELSKQIKTNPNYHLNREEVNKLFDALQETLLKIGVL